MPTDPKLVYEVLQLHRERMRWRAIARALKISRNTVRRIVAEHEVDRKAPSMALATCPARPRPSRLDSFRPRIDALLAQYPDITAQRIYETLREDGFAGGYTGVKTLVRRIRPKPLPTPSLQTEPRVAGELAECDWSEYPFHFTHAPAARLQIFQYILRFSTRKAFSVHEGNGLHPLMDGHVQAFARFEGVAHGCKYDSQKPVVDRWEGGQPIFNMRFIHFATHYEFKAIACRVRHPNDKPRVERAFWEFERSFLNGRSFRDRADLDAQLAHWMNTIADVRPIKRMKRRTRLDLWAEEQPILRALPGHPYDTAQVLYRVCDVEGFVSWEGNRYSLPYDHVTEILPVRITRREIFVYRADLTCVATHELLPRGAQQDSILPGHRPAYAERGPGLDQLRSVFAQLGEGASDFLSVMEKAQPRSAGYHARLVLGLRASWSTQDLVAALRHALAYGALEHGAIERILLSRGTPRTLDQYLARSRVALDPPGASGPRDLGEYDALPVTAAPAVPEVPEVPAVPSIQGTERWPDESSAPNATHASPPLHPPATPSPTKSERESNDT